MITSIVLANRHTAEVLLGRYFDLGGDDRAAWEAQLFALTRSQWDVRREDDERVECWGDNVVVFVGIDDLLVFVTGRDEDDELALLELLRTLTTLLREVTKRATEQALMENYTRIALILEELVHNGIVDQLDKEHILHMSKLKLPGGQVL